MVEVGTLHTKDIFYHKGHEYKVLENSSMFIIAKKIPYDGITRYFLKSIKVEKKLKPSFKQNGKNGTPVAPKKPANRVNRNYVEKHAITLEFSTATG